MGTFRLFKLAAAGAVAGAFLAACGGGGDPGPGSGSGTVDVRATDSTCELSVASVPAGTVTFVVANNGAKVTEFYVYGAQDRVVGEVEDIAPGISRNLRVDLPAGRYTAACKPGMTGDGIRTPLTVSATTG